MKVFMKGSPAEMKGDTPTIGEMAPDFSLNNIEDKEISLKDLKGEKILLSVFPDINTSVCEAQTRKFFTKASEYPNIKIVNISNNTKEELSEWCATNGIDVEMLSDTDLDFAEAYGLYIPEFDILGRSVFLINEEGKLVYKEVLEELSDEPDYDAVFKAVEKL